jgi:hypothetical protein
MFKNPYEFKLNSGTTKISIPEISLKFGITEIKRSFFYFSLYQQFSPYRKGVIRNLV